TAPLGIVMGEIILLLVYLSVFVPLGLTLRLIRGSSMQTPKTTESQSWWTQRKQSQKVSSYYRQS
ncbi:MAG: hypothetical protein KDA85_18985, partial [Planctomycetaceae bacterium]|nr:hypothetical protein [Planctomycetaceae bacterium]